MSIFTSASRGLADKLIGIAGQQMTLTRRAQSGSYNPATGMTIAAQTFTVTATIAPYETFRHMGFHKDQGLDVVQGDQVALISAIGASGAPITPPQVNDLLTAGSKTYTISACAPHSPAGMDLLYLCSVRGPQ
jgi:hypothetical protein